VHDDEDLREDAKRLLRAASGRRGLVTQVDLAAGAEERGLSPVGPRLEALVDYMEVMGWAEVDVFARGVVSATTRRITARGLEVVREGSGPRP
jgi:hypothetical protein